MHIDELPENSNSETWKLRLYIAGQTPRSIRSFANLEKICTHYLEGKSYEIQVIDLLEDPQRAEADQIIVIPTLVKVSPLPLRKIFGDLSNTEKVLQGLQLQPL